MDGATGQGAQILDQALFQPFGQRIAGGLFLAAYVFAFIVYRITSWVLA